MLLWAPKPKYIFFTKHCRPIYDLLGPIVPWSLLSDLQWLPQIFLDG